MTSVTKIQRYENHINTLIKRYPSFKFLADSFFVPDAKYQWEFQGKRRHDMQILFIGKTGYGKSTTVNAIVKKNIFQSSDIQACTNSSQCADYYLNDDKETYLSFCDLPGIGESAEQDKEYLALYERFLKATSVIVYLLRADQRDFAIDLSAFETVLGRAGLKDKVIIALNAADKVEPLTRTAANPYSPTAEQRRNILDKITVVSRLFDIPKERIVAISAAERWNLDGLMQAVSTMLQRSDHVMVPPWHGDEWKRLINRLSGGKK